MINNEKNLFTWMPIYTELAQRLLAFKNNRHDLMELIYNNNVLKQYTSYLHQQNGQPLNDIDPLSFLGIFNRGNSFENRKVMLSAIKTELNLSNNVPEDFDGIPILDNRKSFYLSWDNEEMVSKSCSNLWDFFASFMNDDLKEHDFNNLLNQNGIGLAMITMPLFWCKPNDFLALDSRNVKYLNSYGINIQINDLASYKNLLKEVKNKMSTGNIRENSFAEISYNAWKSNSRAVQFWSGGIKWNGGQTNKLDDFNKNHSWQIGWDKDDDSKGAKQAWNNIKKVKTGDYLAFHGYGGKNDLTIYQVSRVVGKDEKNGKLFFEQLNDPENELYHGKAPKMDMGGWWGTLFQITGEDAINKIFRNYIGAMENNHEIKEFTRILSLKKNLILQGAPGTGKTYNTAALALSICGEAIPETHEDVMKRYEELRKEGRIGFCTFHQSMDYEDFVEGIKPIKPDEGELYYRVEDGIFKTICKNAINKDSQNYVLIIDEINRGNVSKIFGELITLLEADKRCGGDHPIKVTLPYSKESFGVPSNLYIIGTMNTTDRSVGNIDYAVRRRFAFVTLESKEEVIEQHYKNDETMKIKALGLFKSVKLFLEKHKFDMDIADLMVGHSYFLAKDEEELGLKWKYEIVPLLHEYYKDGITKQDVKADTSIDDFCNSK